MRHVCAQSTVYVAQVVSLSNTPGAHWRPVPGSPHDTMSFLSYLLLVFRLFELRSPKVFMDWSRPRAQTCQQTCLLALRLSWAVCAWSLDLNGTSWHVSLMECGHLPLVWQDIPMVMDLPCPVMRHTGMVWVTPHLVCLEYLTKLIATSKCLWTFYLFNQHKVTRVTNLSEYLPTLYLFNNTRIRVKHDLKISSYWKCLGRKMFQLRKDTREALVPSLKERWIR